jgi:hypothetical protein
MSLLPYEGWYFAEANDRNRVKAVAHRGTKERNYEMGDRNGRVSRISEC